MLLHLLGRGATPEQVRDTLTVCFIGLAPIGAAALFADRVDPSCPTARWCVGLMPAVLVAHLVGRRGFAWLAAGERYEPVLTVVLLVAVVVGLIGALPRPVRLARQMAQAHGDRLSAVDASFLAQERANSHMHVGAVLIFEGPAPAYDDFLNHIRSRLHLVPRYRHKLAFPPLETGRPIWIDDPSFNLEYHVRHTALPQPGSEEQLRALAARIHSQRLDRAKPLWETWLVQGLERGRFALISKSHHALVDGIAGVDLMTVLFDATPIPQQSPRTRASRGRRRPSRARCSSPRAGCKGLARLPFELAGGALSAATHPADVAGAPSRRRSRGSARSPGPGLNPAPDDAAERADRPAPAARRSCATTSATSSSSRTRSAGRSTTSC